jgi:L-aminopeptidase/D-esterase-like protein
MKLTGALVAACFFSLAGAALGPVRTGVTAIFPRGKNNAHAVFAGYFAGNGDMTGTHWVEESGLVETPILITHTGSVGAVGDAAVAWMVFLTGRVTSRLKAKVPSVAKMLNT